MVSDSSMSHMALGVLLWLGKPYEGISYPDNGNLGEASSPTVKINVYYYFFAKQKIIGATLYCILDHTTSHHLQTTIKFTVLGSYFREFGNIKVIHG